MDHCKRGVCNKWYDQSSLKTLREERHCERRSNARRAVQLPIIKQRPPRIDGRALPLAVLHFLTTVVEHIALIMNFGYGVGDFIAICNLARNVYKSCKNAPDSFRNIASEVFSLHAVLKEAEETVFAETLSPTRQDRLNAVGDGCRRVLEDLQKLVEKYEKLGTQRKRLWDRMGWGSENIAELRTRLISNTGLLTAWIRCVCYCQWRYVPRLIGYQPFSNLCREEAQSISERVSGREATGVRYYNGLPLYG
jgi:hypothetical protein